MRLKTDEPAAELADVLNPAKDKVTVSAQTYQNYRSALRWWHEYNCPRYEKIGHPWPGDVDWYFLIHGEIL
jgi:hypothetical protein